MARFTSRWLEIARDRYHSLPQDHQRAIDTRVAELLERPEGPAGAYHRRRDHWTTPYGDGLGLIVYAISTEHDRVLILRFVGLARPRRRSRRPPRFRHSDSATGF